MVIGMGARLNASSDFVVSLFRVFALYFTITVKWFAIGQVLSRFIKDFVGLQ